MSTESKRREKIMAKYNNLIRMYRVNVKRKPRVDRKRTTEDNTQPTAHLEATPTTPESVKQSLQERSTRQSHIH
jgi:hypothetical protein